MAIKIGLDAGHGLNTPGKQTPTGIKEWTLNDAVCDKIQERLKDYDCEIIRTDHNEGSVDESLTQRVNEYLNAGVKAFVSIHHNAFTGNWSSATGVEVYTDKTPTAGDTKLAKIIYDNLVKNTGLKGRGIKKANFTVINQNKVPAILVEGGFMDSTIDYKIITSEEGQNNYAKAVAEGLVEFCGLTKKETPVPAPAPAPAPQPTKISVIYQVYDERKKQYLPNVTDNTDYAGIFGDAISCVYANLTQGNIYYGVHVLDTKTRKARWLPMVKNREDFAGLCGQPIDGFVAYTDTGKTLRYRVHLKGAKRWLPYVTGCNVNDNSNGYAGLLGQEIDAIEMYLI